MKDITIAITAASYSGNKGAAAMLQSSITQLKEAYAEHLTIHLMSVYPSEDRCQCPHDFVQIIPAKPQQVLFLAFPCAIFYRIFSWNSSIRACLKKNKMIKAYTETDLVIDEAGISFSDNRGWIMNTYAFVCMAIPMLMGVPVVKYSQAMGPFHNRYNRFLAKWILPKAKLVIARGRFTYGHLHAIGIDENVQLCADGAFTMPSVLAVEKLVQQACEKFDFTHTIALSISSVVARKCQKTGVNYCKIITEFICYLTALGYQVYMFANAARINSKNPRNNDLMIGDIISKEYHQIERGEHRLIWEHREMDAEEIRAYIGQCELLIASRFHAMVFALSKQVPVMLIGWSHKYQEVMEQFELGEYAVDYTNLSLEYLKQCFEQFVQNQEEIKKRIKRRLPIVQRSSKQNIRAIRKIIDTLPDQTRQRYMNHVIHLDQPEIYMGTYLSCKMGYALDSHIRENAASGGMVTALLCNLLKNKTIDGAWVVKTIFTESGELSYQTYIATTPQQICESSSSVYMKIPMLAHLDQLRQFDGKLAVVLTPCMMQALVQILEKEDTLREKIVCKIGLFCSGAYDKRATEYALDHCHIPRNGAKRLYYRRGHWRGISSVLYTDGTQREFSYTKTICAYKNAYFFVENSCLTCKDQFAKAADISFGDVWLSEVKKEPVKYTGCIVRSQKALAALQRAESQGDLDTKHMTEEQMLRSQMRALTFKYRGKRWNHKLAGWLADKNRRFSKKHPGLLKKIPMPIIYYYMCMIRVLLSW